MHSSGSIGKFYSECNLFYSDVRGGGVERPIKVFSECPQDAVFICDTADKSCQMNE